MQTADYWARFWAKVDASGDCWEWTGSGHTRGYGMFQLGGAKLAHRVAWQLLVGSIPPGLVLDHLCRNKRCVNPDHLEPVTNAENIKRGAPSGRPLRTHCRHGHPFDMANTYFRPDGARACKTCVRAAGIRYLAKRRTDDSTHKNGTT